MDMIIFWTAAGVITLIIFFILQKIFDWKKEIDVRIRFLEKENSNKTAKLDLLEKITLNPFKKGRGKTK